MNAQTPTKADWSSIDTSVEHQGTKIILPGDPTDMSYDEAIATLQRVKKDAAQKFDVSEVVSGAPWDAAVAIYRAMQSIYGVVLATSKETFFGPILPDMLTVKTGPNPTDVVQVPIGSMQLPNVTEKVDIGIFPGGAYIRSSVVKVERARLVEIANLARKIMRTDSIYKGKAIRLRVDDDGALVLSQQPEFVDLSTVLVTDMIHTHETEGLIRTNIFSPLMNTEACRKHKIPLKRGVLLEGRYGTGKSLTARVTAKVATDNGWTFVMLDRAQGLKTAIEFCTTYQPCVIFAEDIDRAADRDDEAVNDLVNLIDGVISKTMEIMVVLTTNFVDKIDKALLRPGRFDAVISIQAPDPETVQRLVRAYARDLLAPDLDISRVGEILDGQIPATVREVVERAKLAMLAEGRTSLSVPDLGIAAVGMKRHLDLLNGTDEVETPEKKLWAAMSELVRGATGELDQADLTDVTTAAKIAASNAKAAVEKISGVDRTVKAVAGGVGAVMDTTRATEAKVDELVKR